jgi:hypothetical protein
METPEQIAQFHTSLAAVIHRARSEYDLTLASVIGTLEIVKLELYSEESARRKDQCPGEDE